MKNGSNDEGEVERAPVADPFDPRRLRIGQRIGDTTGVRRIVVSVPVRKPGRQEFIRTHPSLDMWIETAVLEVKSDRLIYLVEPSLMPHLSLEAMPKVLVTSMNTLGAVFLWPIKLPDDLGRHDEWNATALEAAERARTKFIRLVSNVPAGTYDVLEATGGFSEPVWPDLTLNAVLAMAFKDRVIDDLDHPVLKRLRGEL